MTLPFHPRQEDVIKKEIDRLLDAGFIKVYHPDWLADRVLVPKKNKDGKMCVDYTDLNKASKKDPLGSPKSIRLWTPQSVATL
jgi:hypothetical protein